MCGKGPKRIPDYGNIPKDCGNSPNVVILYLNIYKTLSFLRLSAVFLKTVRHTKTVDGSMDSPHYGGHRRHSLMLIE